MDPRAGRGCFSGLSMFNGIISHRRRDATTVRVYVLNVPDYIQGDSEGMGSVILACK